MSERISLVARRSRHGMLKIKAERRELDPVSCQVSAYLKMANAKMLRTFAGGL